MKDAHKSSPAATLLLITCLLATLVPGLSIASPVPPYFQVPPWEGVPDKGLPSDPIRICCIFVTFPNTDPACLIYPANAEQVLSDVEQSMQYQSRGLYAVDYSILRNPASQDLPWAADHNSGLYMGTNPLAPPSDYPNCSVTDGAGVSNELPLEILGKVQAAYPAQHPLANYDAIAFVYRTTGSDITDNPLNQEYGGYSAILVPASCEDLADVLEGAPISPTDNSLFGYTSIWWTIDGPNYPRFNMAHEWGHKMAGAAGFPHTAGSDFGNFYVPTADEVCYFGAYSVMRPVHVGRIAYGMYNHWERDVMGWCTPDTVTANRRGITLEDFDANGTILRVPIRDEAGAPCYPGVPEYNSIPYLQEYFLLAYEGDRDTYYDPSDTGLYVWHVVEAVAYFPDATPPHWTRGAARYLDLEVASGLDAMPSLTLVPWSHPDPVNGHDMLDNWTDVATSLPRQSYVFYNGSLDDLYNIGTGENREFSFRASSNPNTNGLDWSYDASIQIGVSRLTPQSRQNSIMIRILEQTPDAVVLDVLLAPYEDVATPNGGELLRVGAPTSITWNVDASLAISTVDIAYSANGGVDYEVVAAGEANDGEYSWTPAAGQESAAGKIKIVYHNNRSTNVGDDESDGTFTVAGPVLYADKSDSTGLNYEGVPYSSVVMDYDSDGKKDLFISMRDDYGSLQRQTGLNQGEIPQYADETDYAFASGSGPQIGLRGLAVGDYDNDGAVDFFAAAESGARVYHNDGGVFTDVSDVVGITAYATNSWAGAWGDYDRDGQLDLFVARGEGATQDPTPTSVTPLNGYLLHNRTREYGTFVGAEIQAETTNASVACAWADVDGDSDLDLFVGDIRSSAATPLCRLYMNQGDGVFIEDYADRFPGADVAGITSVSWADCDNNGAVDLVVGSQLQAPMVFLNDGTGHFGGSAPLVADLTAATNGVSPLDHDLDGRMDLMALPREASDHPWLLANRNTSSGIAFVDESVQVGLEASAGRVDGMVAADLNGDGDEDLYLGRPVEAGKYFYQARTSYGDAPVANWVGVLLDPNSGANNDDGIGATVTVTVGDPAAPLFKQAQIVDGGSGRGGQADRTLIFGLGDLEGVIQAEVHWPGGYVQTQQLVAGTVNVVNDLTAPTMVVLKNRSPLFTYEVVPGSALIDWIFTWQTQFSCDPSLDQVRVSCRPRQPSTCLCDERTLHVGDANVEARVYAMADSCYQHSLRWRGVPCAASCSYNFTMGSATQRAGSLNETSMVGTISFCPTDYDPEEE